MKTIVRGEKIKLSDYHSTSQLQVDVNIDSSFEIDIACFGLDANQKLADDRYMVFYNQQESPSKEIRLLNQRSGVASFSIDLAKLPPASQQLVFTATIDGNGTMSMISSGYIRFSANGQPFAEYIFNGNDFQNEQAVIISEVYFKSLWRISAVGKGFDGGLAALLKHFGGVVEEELTETLSQPAPAPTQNKKSLLEKKMAEKAPKIFDLSKKAKVSLEKAGLSSHQAKVALCLDISGSMSSLYRSGKIQEFAEKILALGSRFDDDGSIDIFLFGQDAHDVGEMSIDNFHGFISNMNRQYPLEGGTYYGKVMKSIRNHYFGQISSNGAPISKDIPVYVMFVTDGATIDEAETIKQITQSSFEPIFWQFMAIGKSNKDVKARGFFQRIFNTDFSFLEKLDHLTGRYIDNANFFSVEDPTSVTDEVLYDLLMEEYPVWVKEATSKGLIVHNRVRMS